jgi:hypothetical protein
VIAGTIPDAFRGDAHALLVAIYRDPRHPLDLRLDAAKAAVRFEKPALASTTLDATLRNDPSTLSDAQLAAIACLGGADADQASDDPAQSAGVVHRGPGTAWAEAGGASPADDPGA